MIGWVIEKTQVPPACGGGAAAQLEHPAAARFAEQESVGLAQTLGAPHEVDVAEEPAVLVLVLVGVAVSTITGYAVSTITGYAGTPR